MEKLIETYIPNWKRFCDKYSPDGVFVDAFEKRLGIIVDEELQISVSKKINIELGILLLAYKEVNEGVFGEIIKSMKK